MRIELLVLGLLPVLLAAAVINSNLSAIGPSLGESFHLRGVACIYVNDELWECNDNAVVNNGKNFTRDDLAERGYVNVTYLVLANCTGAQGITDTELCAGGTDIWNTCGLVNKTGTYVSRDISV